MLRSRVARTWTGAFLIAAMLLTLLPAVGGQAAPGDRTVVASGLNNPRYVAIAPDGTLYVTEAGNGGTQELPTPSPDPGDPPVPLATRGMSGQVTKVAPGGAQSVVASGLPSYNEGTGPTGIVYAAGALWVAVGGAGHAYPEIPLLPYENTIVRIDPATGIVDTTADIGAYERAFNPDGTDINPNLYGLTLAADGQLYANDAGGNVTYRLNPTTWTFDIASILPQLTLGEGSLHAVPTGAASDLVGNVYIGELPGELAPGAGRVVRLAPDGSLTTAVEGLTTVTGVAIGPDGLLYVSQLIGGFGEGGPTPGSVLRVLPNGTTEVVADALPFPQGIAFDAAGNLYVATNTTAFGPPPPTPNGEVVRIEAVAPPPATTFCDVTAGTPNAAAITYWARRNVIRGYENGCFGPDDTLLRAQLTGMEARAFLWDQEDRGNPFSDQGPVDDELWRTVGVLAFYDVARGYGDGTFDPTGPVLNVQAISLISRAMVTKGFWRLQGDDPSLFPSITAASGHRLDVLTFYHYVGSVPGTGGATTPWGGAEQPATRAYFANALYLAYRSYFAANPLP